MTTRISKGTTYYSDVLRGSEANYDWTAECDVTDGYVRISQRKDGALEIVLLSPTQWRAIVAFVDEHTAR
jgi:hypothetical protein